MRISKIYENIANTSFVILFPTSFFYFWFVAEDLIPAVFRGYYGRVAAALLMPLLLVYILRELRIPARIFFLDLSIYLLIALLLLTALINFSLGANAEVVFNHIATSIYFIVIFLIFRGMRQDSSFFAALNTLALVGATIVVLIYSTAGALRLIGNFGPNGETAASYQFIAVSILVVSLIPLTRGRLPLRIFVYLASVVILFFNGARSEFVVLIALFFIIETYKARRPVLLISVFVAITASAALWAVDFLAQVDSNRVAKLFIGGLASSGSFLERREVLADGIQTISSHPFLGSYASYQPGSYIHNWISAWVDLGAIGFVIYTVLMILPLIWAIQQKIHLRRRSNKLLLLICLSVASISALIFAKSFEYILFPAAYGYFVNLNRNGFSQPNDSLQK